MKTAPLDRTMKPEPVTGSVEAMKVIVQDEYGTPVVDTPQKDKSGLKISARKTAVLVGVLFLVQMITAMIGSSLIQAFVDGDADKTRLTIGVLLGISAGVAVVGIGFLMYPVLRLVSRKLAIWYPVLRVLELTVTAACGIYLLTQLKVVPNHLLWIYIPTGIGGLILTYLLFVSRLVPRPIAALGLVGYALLLFGVPVDLLSSMDMNAGPGLVLLAPGGLFEFLFLPIWLFAKGFKLPEAATN
jgi:hypothetical protein